MQRPNCSPALPSTHRFEAQWHPPGRTTPLFAHGAGPDCATVGEAAATALVDGAGVTVCPVLMAGVRIIGETLGGTKLVAVAESPEPARMLKMGA